MRCGRALPSGTVFAVKQQVVSQHSLLQCFFIWPAGLISSCKSFFGVCFKQRGVSATWGGFTEAAKFSCSHTEAPHKHFLRNMWTLPASPSSCQLNVLTSGVIPNASAVRRLLSVWWGMIYGDERCYWNGRSGQSTAIFNHLSSTQQTPSESYQSPHMLLPLSGKTKLLLLLFLQS